MSREVTVARIARDHLNLPTLETRNSDRQDFHELAVWDIKHALEVAYEAGRYQALNKPKEI